MKKTYFFLPLLTLFIASCGDKDEVSKVDQTITFETLRPYNLSELNFTLTATASSGLPVSYTSSNPTVASVSGSTVTLLKEGTTTITASQPGNDKYYEALKISRSLTVNDDVSATKKDQTITSFDLPEEWFYSQGTLELSATASSGLPVSFSTNRPEWVIIQGSTLSLTTDGQHYENEEVLIIASQSGNTEWKAAPSISKTLRITHDSE